MAAENARWVQGLDAVAPEHETTVAELYRMLLRMSYREAQRRGSGMRLSGPELDDVAHQAASDATMAVRRKVGTFRGECRFTTWAYRFVVFDVASKMNRHPWRRPTVSLDDHDWDLASTDLYEAPQDHLETKALLRAFEQVFSERLTGRQQRAFEAIAVRGLPVAEVARELGTNPNAVYKTMFDARKKLREGLVAVGFLEAGRPVR
ncbi:RNA polymerase sigma factor [Auraticoccus monumenti]|uniref:RNA polymerase sigma-70 factor, ECF subfamily n=1 Tax=Auraticoccus monumenti TaxID=675864 RepID=A0A1G7C0M9_9ACTN|nr:sigma-70 family RNA polymerase sigma factor [Auraticoccus monumenti]SDE32246.1 RNA polymerase sigma-70 factor, ECF subfamily [Auraticoccus monumenti]